MKRGISDEGFSRIASISKKAEMNSYPLGELTLDGLETYKDGSWGDIVIGGDKGDVHIGYASSDEHGVFLDDVILRSGLEDLAEEEAREIAMDIILRSYESIGSETFAGKTQW